VAKSLDIGSLLARALLVGTVVATLFTAGEAAARVAVTASTTGDPLGRPPGEAERILIVGTDVQANEVITTSSNARAHLIFLDGTSLTVGPDAELTVDKFVYDPDSKKGEMAINASKGVFRLIGGRISKTSAITVTTPSATMGIRGGIAGFQVTASSTTSALLFGNTLTVTAGGVTQTITVPGLQVTAIAGGTPGAPVALQGNLAVALAALATGGPAANAAVALAIQTLVANATLSDPVTLQAVLQAIINVTAPTTLTTAITTLAIIPNPNVQTQQNAAAQLVVSPN
jgi:hypothetical protein